MGEWADYPVDCSIYAFIPPHDSPLIDAGDPSILDPDGTRSDIGATGGPYAATTVADVFYLIPPPLQRELLAACRRMLAPDGVLLWKSQVRRPRWKYAITRGQEWLMTTLGPTAGHGLYFLDTDESLDAMRAAGFRGPYRVQILNTPTRKPPP